MSLSFTDYDIEDFMVDLKSVLVANLNTYITQMNSDRPTPQLGSIDNNAYYIQSLSDEHAAYENFIFIFEDDTSGIENGPATIESYDIVVALVTSYKNEASEHMAKRLWRYRKILKTIIRKSLYSNKLSRPQKVELKGLSPFPVSLANSDDMAVAAAIQLEVSFA